MRSPSPVLAAGVVLSVLGAAALTLVGGPAAAAPDARALASAAAPLTQAQLYNGAIPDDVVAASAAPGHHWTPEAATYGVGSRINVPLTMADGTVLRLNVFYPTDPATGAAAPGPFPVLLTQTPYGKGQSATPATGSGATGGADTYLLDRGYIEVVADVRGTGDSQGNFGLFDPVQTSDGVALVNYAAGLPDSTHTVGLYGPSYLGINQLLTAGAVGRNSPLKAIFPLVSANDIYRDTSSMGGLIDTEFGLSYLGGITAGLNVANPALDATMGAPDALTVEPQHVTDVAAYNAAFSAGILADQDSAYDQDYWKAREPRSILSNIVANNIPAYLVGGEYDIFQRGEPLNFAGLQNAYDGRPVTAPMLPGQATTGRYQLLDGPFTHLVGSAPAIDPLQLEWFDTWLKNEDTGMGTTPTPLHYFDLGTNGYAETTTYPFTGVTPTRYYLDPAKANDSALSTNDGSLSPTPPAAAGTDTMVYSPAGSPCGRSVDQWGLGAYSFAAQSLTVTSEPCVTDDRTTGAGPSALTYTTAAFPAARTLAGPITASVYATNLTTTDSEWVAEIEDVAPDGTSKPLTEGALLGSLRAVDASQSWQAADGQYELPYHPYTRASAQQVPAGQQARYDIEVFPTYSTIAAGHRIRITLSSSDVPHLSADAVQTPNLVGGVYQVAHGPSLSSVELPLSGASAGAPAVTAVTAVTATGTAAHAAAKPSTRRTVKTVKRVAARSAASQPAGTLAYTGLTPVLPLAAAGLLALAWGAGRRQRRRHEG